MPVKLYFLAIAALWALPVASSGARTVEYHLYVREAEVSPAGKRVPGLTINDTIPGPVLRFREGDTARIHVHNQLSRGTTSMHWHGLLLPNAQDGVPGVTTPWLEAGSSWTYTFPIVQSGTFWYHSHTHFQEQSGLYGAIVIEPRKPPASSRGVIREEVLLFSDWTNEDPHQVHRNLVRGTEWYALRKGTAQSLWGAWKAGALGDFFERERIRMKPMDLSDVAYDAFLVNGRPRLDLAGKSPGKVRLRLVNGSSSTYFYVSSSAGPLQLVAADGKEIVPVFVDRLLMAIGETYDAILTLPAGGRYEVRATAQDGSGSASAFLGEGVLRPAADPPPPAIYQMDHMLEAALEEAEAVRSPRPSAPYALLKSPVSTAFARNRPVRKIPLHLTGDMERYQWSFNGKTITEESVIPVQKGEILQIEMVNDTMMHHPIHLHGYYFRVINEQGARSPWKHTVDVPPMGRRTIEFEADATGDWMFHCHLLYHMMAGMGRVFSVREEPPGERMHGMGPSIPEIRTASPHSTVRFHAAMEEMGRHGAVETTPAAAATPAAEPRADRAAASHGSGHHGSFLQKIFPSTRGVRQAEALGVDLGEHAHEMISLWGTASVQTHLSEGQIILRRANWDFQALWEVGWQDTDRTEYEVEVLMERYVNPNLRFFGGMRLSNEEEASDRATVGVRYRTPGMFWSAASVDSEGDLRLSLTKSLPLTARLMPFAGIQYDTGSGWEWDAGAEYILTQSISLTTQYSSEYGFGGGVVIRF